MDGLTKVLWFSNGGESVVASSPVPSRGGMVLDKNSCYIVDVRLV